jgi:putative endopeptidase
MSFDAPRGVQSHDFTHAPITERFQFQRGGTTLRAILIGIVSLLSSAGRSKKHSRKSNLVSVALSVFGALMALSSACAQNSVPNLRYGNWGLDLNAMDRSTRPGDDFFKFANGAWLEQAVIPADKSRVTLRALMTDKTEVDLRTLLETEAQRADHEPSSVNGKVGAFYKAFMNEDVIESRGADPVAPILVAIRMRITREALGALMGRAKYDFIGSFFEASIYADAKNPNQYAVYLNQSGLGLPDRDYYLQTDPKSRRVKAAYQSYVEKMLSLVGWPEPTKNAARIVAMETRHRRGTLDQGRSPGAR